MNEIFIPGNVPSAKNSTIVLKNGRRLLSKTVQRYLKSLGIYSFSSKRKTVKEYKTRDNIFRSLHPHFQDIKYPLKIYFHFVRNSNRKFDFINACQIIQDLLVAHDMIEDDDMKHLLPHPYERDGKWYSIDTKNPGVWIKF